MVGQFSEDARDIAMTAGPRQSVRGVTLLELTLVVALVCLLGAIAVPSYVAHIDRSRISRAVGDIGGLSLEIARWQLSFGNLPDTLAEIGLDGRLDPWGNLYVYLNAANANRGAVRRDRNLNPVNTDFDLYSIGKDGQTSTAFTSARGRDDVVRANNGAYIGLAEGY